MTNQRAEDEPGAGRVPDDPTTLLPAGPAAMDAEPDARTEPVTAPQTPAAPPAEAGPPAEAAPPAEAEAAPEPEPITKAEPIARAEPIEADPIAEAEPIEADPVTRAEPFGGGPELVDNEPPPLWGNDEPRLAGGTFPPPAGFPPPPPGDIPAGTAAGGYPPPPPGTDGFATRYGLYRPTEGRRFAGVCAAFGRATNTDPVLWRVLLAVFTLAGGIGLILYVLGWLLIPDEGDSASPVEALLGRGQSRTNPIVVILVTIGTFIGLGLVLTHRATSIVIPFGLIIVAIVLFTRRDSLRRAAGGMPPAPPPFMSSGPPVPPPGMSYQPPSTGPVGYAPPGYAPPTPGAQPGGYRPPFAPHGPYADASPYPYPGLLDPPLPPPPPPVPPRTPRPPKPRPPRSRLGLVIFSLALLTLGVLAIVDLAFGGVPFQGYVAGALGAIGVGLVIGAWYGRAKLMILPGLVLLLILAASVPIKAIGPMERGGGDITWTPDNITNLSDTYVHGVGDATLDLSQLDFTGQNRVLRIHVNAGDVQVMLPPKVDVDVNATIKAGDARVLGTEWNGVNAPVHRITDKGTDGAGGGHLVLNILVNVGSLEVAR
jgi:phage shock protein PspC (stress-responsive transcriptional regulator)